ncbi:hypothetical protein BV25DRAFT_1827647 [Artomyces pyxidatus]|uniref:Uncharacterized protein n=1 Tax=Artomyces pyxidatus TaxID=48021 RepID=A0ACB8SYH8_9AGAM|nr:hypothetical protein BV25DRAFT_1827647 [Artomyces pyxidatus]
MTHRLTSVQLPSNAGRRPPDRSIATADGEPPSSSLVVQTRRARPHLGLDLTRRSAVREFPMSMSSPDMVQTRQLISPSSRDKLPGTCTSAASARQTYRPPARARSSPVPSSLLFAVRRKTRNTFAVGWALRRRQTHMAHMMAPTDLCSEARFPSFFAAFPPPDSLLQARYGRALPARSFTWARYPGHVWRGRRASADPGGEKRWTRPRESAKTQRDAKTLSGPRSDRSRRRSGARVDGQDTGGPALILL